MVNGFHSGWGGIWRGNVEERRLAISDAETLTPPADWQEAMVVIVGKPVSFAGGQLGSSQRVTRFIVPKAGAS